MFLGFSLTNAYALTVEIYNIAGGGLSSQINFDAATDGTLYLGANQYIKIDNPGLVQREVRIYTSNSSWEDPVSPNPVSLETYPLHSIGFASFQPNGVEFNSASESQWQRIRDINETQTAPLGLTLKPNEVRYVYFGTKTPFAAPGLSYQTNILVEVIDGASLAAPQDQAIRPPQTVVTPNGDGINDLAVFGITGSFEIKIFNIKGKTVRTLENNNAWDGRNDDGDLVESGIYAYKVKASGVKVSGMIAVAR
ncbi:MAG: hypothetical protein A2901_05845 [Elusimicrobia bacterium RIFCSPLOWO2_01_FULL_54_10]|nr:MAG: hypothetical protein A2901_05845 [Elusimicrobia bacterium RIFCSPLOWO2_01_FULL_54_10]